MGSLRGSCAQIDDQRHLILAGQPQKIADSLVDRKAKKAACKLMICRPHVLVCLALQVVEDFFITIDRRIQSAIIQLRIRCGLVSRRPSVLRNSSADKCDTALFALASRK